jgi:O-antigen/teichoic acid export membrane protein
MKNKFLKSVMKVLFGNLTTIVSGVVIGFLLPMLISVSDYGYYKTFTLYMSYIGCFALGMIDGINLNYAGTSYNELNKKEFRLYYKVLLILQFMISLLIIIFAILFFSGNLRIIFVVLGLIIIPNNLSGYFQQISQATQRFNEYAIRNIVKSIGNIVILIIMFIMLKTGHSVSYVHYIVLFLVINVLLFVWYIITYRDIVFGQSETFKCDRTKILLFIKNGFPLMISNLCATLILTIDRQFVSVLFSKEQYAIYAFAYNLLSLITVAISSISIVLFPMLKQEAVSNLSKKYNMYVSLILLLVGTMLVAYFPLVALIRIILPKYSESLIYFRIMFPSLLGSSAVTVIMHNYYKSMGKNLLFFKKSMVILIMSIIANTIAYSISRNMISFSIATIVITLLWYIYAEQTLVRTIMTKSLKNTIYYIAVCIVFYFSTFLVNNLLLSSILYIIVFFIISVLLQKDATRILFRKIRKA